MENSSGGIRNSVYRGGDYKLHLEMESMTNKEAIEILKRGYPDIQRYAASEYEDYLDCVDLYDEALDHVIKALEEKPQGDSISREWVIHNVLSLVDPETRIYAKQRLDDAPTVENITIFCENADEKAVADLKAELQNVIKERQKGGEWILQYRNLNGEYYTCSQCGRMILVDPDESLSDYPFCHCGADMRGEEE